MKPSKRNPPAPDRRLVQIWKLVRRVPRGSVVTYGDIARAVRPPCNPRLIGPALGKAPPGLQLPWHRVLAAGGRIALLGAHGLDQRLRLQAEGVTFSGRRVRLAMHQWKPTTSRRVDPERAARQRLAQPRKRKLPGKSPGPR